MHAASFSGRTTGTIAGGVPSRGLGRVVAAHPAPGGLTPRPLGAGGRADSTVCGVASVPSAPSSSTDGGDTQEDPLIVTPGDEAQGHPLTALGREVMQDLTPWAEEKLMPLLKDPQTNWQCNDFLPDAASPDFEDQVIELRNRCANLPDDLMVVLVGDMITEEALPTYMNMLNLMDTTRDETGAQGHAWAQWTRGWTAEENRHGDLLNKYLWLSGKVSMRDVETTIQNLVGHGMDAGLEANPYLCFVYTSFQERATKVSHGATARIAAEHGETSLAKVCGLIAADEGRHEEAYKRIVEQVLQRDPEGGLLAFEDMMRKQIVMPGHLMDDDVHVAANAEQASAGLFEDYSRVAQNIGVYTAHDYANILEHLVKRWKIADMQGLSGDGARAQEYLMGEGARIRRIADRLEERRERQIRKAKARPSATFSWVGGRSLEL